MIKKKILVVASYPIVNPQHGGQKRVKAIVDLYSGLFEDVRFVGVFHRTAYDQRGKYDLLVAQKDIMKKIEESPYAIDIIAGQAIDNDIHVRSPMAKILMDYKPDIIQIEQPFNYLGLKPLLKELNMHPRIIFSSHNIEYLMKEEIYKALDLPAKTRELLVSRVKEIEEKFSRDADLVIAVSEEDAEAHYQMGAKHCIVAPNGIDKPIVSQNSKKKWDQYKKQFGIQKAVIFVGSAHPPNWIGFLKMIGEDMSFLPSDTKILLVGGVSEYFATAHQFSSDRQKKLFKQGAITLGKLNDEDLAGLIEQSDTILLPITSGGGSNLKTAEAILSNKKIVATDYALRSFEKYEDLPNLYITSNPQTFKEYINQAVSSELIPRNREQNQLAEQVQWKYTLAGLVPILKRISRVSISSKARRVVRGYARKVRSQARRVIS